LPKHNAKALEHLRSWSRYWLNNVSFVDANGQGATVITHVALACTQGFPHPLFASSTSMWVGSAQELGITVFSFSTHCIKHTCLQAPSSHLPMQSVMLVISIDDINAQCPQSLSHPSLSELQLFPHMRFLSLLSSSQFLRHVILLLQCPVQLLCKYSASHLLLHTSPFAEHWSSLRHWLASTAVFGFCSGHIFVSTHPSMHLASASKQGSGEELLAMQVVILSTQEARHSLHSAFESNSVTACVTACEVVDAELLSMVAIVRIPKRTANADIRMLRTIPCNN